MTEQTMIERVARAIALADDEDYMEDHCRFDKRAKAALAAMREPTEAMINGGVRAPNYLEDQSSKRGCGNIYRAMIDAALAEG